MSNKRTTNRRLAKPKVTRLDKWEVQNAADTLMRAGEIEDNSRLKAAAKKELVKRKAAITKVIKKKPKT